MVKRVTDRETGENLACKIMTLPPDGGTAADGESTRTDIFKEIDIIMTLRTCMWFLLNIVAGVCGVVWIVLLLLVCVGVVEERCAHGNLGPWTVGHPNIIYMKEYFEENGRVYVVMEFLAGGELLEALLNKEKGEDGTCFLVVDVAGLCWVHGRRGRRRRFQETLKLCPPTSPERERDPSEATDPRRDTHMYGLNTVAGNEPHYAEQDARIIFRQLLEAVKYMHDKQIVHRDLKLENMLLAKPNDINTIKIADFGLAKKYGHAALSTICGTPQYVAPEVIKGGSTPYTYGKECDLWSCGVILFILLGGYPPFYDESEPRLFRKIREGKPDYDDPVWKEVSDDAKDLLHKLLNVDPKKRLTVEKVLSHPWMNPRMDDGVSKKDLLRTMSKMRTSFKGKSLAVADAGDGS